MVMDSKPFGDLHQILQEVSDDRIWVFAEWVSTLRRQSALGCVGPRVIEPICTCCAA